METRTADFFGDSGRSEPDLLEVGKLAQTRGDSAMALQLWGKQLQRRPSEPEAYLLAGRLLRELKRCEQAERVLRKGVDQCPDDLSLVIEYARVAEDLSNWPQAMLRWQQALGLFPFHPIATGGVAQALIELGFYPEADAQLVTMREYFPDDYYFAVLFATVATKQQAWPEALRRWQDVKMIKPDCEMASSHIELIDKLVSVDSRPAEETAQ